MDIKEIDKLRQEAENLKKHLLSKLQKETGAEVRKVDIEANRLTDDTFNVSVYLEIPWHDLDAEED